MKPGKEGYRVAVMGATSLLGKELTAILEEGKFPVSRLVTFEADDGEPELPIIDLTHESAVVVDPGQVNEADLDFTFLAAPVKDSPEYLKTWQEHGTAARSIVIDLVGDGFAASKPEEARIGIPFLDHRYPVAGVHAKASRSYVSPHAAVIVISSLLLRLAARFPLESVVAQVLSPASEFSSRGIDELQRQTTNILAFQSPPDEIFGAQLAFNVLPRTGKSGKGQMQRLEDGLHCQLNQYLGGRVPVPALRMITVPTFYSVAVSLLCGDGPAGHSRSRDGCAGR